MLEIFEKFISLLTSNPTLNAIVPATSIYTGPVDIVIEKQNTLPYPVIVLTLASETSRSNPPVRDTMIQLDIWSRNSQLELENIYEQIITILNYQISNQTPAHIFWQRLGNAVDLNERDRRLWHRSCTFTVWSIKPNPS